MILNSSQSVQTSNPLGTSTVSRVIDTSRSTSSRSASSSASSKSDSDTQQQRAAEQTQQQSEQRMLRELQARDREVRAHEAAHAAAGGSLVVSGPSFTYQRGPDGRSYAIGGEVQLDVSPVSGDPEATLEKSQQVRQAALAPAEPSPQDFKVAASATQMAARARIDIAIQRREEAQLEEKQSGLATELEQGEASTTSAGDENTDETKPVVATSNMPASDSQVNNPPDPAINRFISTSNTMSQAESAATGFSRYA